jgi:hypothetical protein
MVAADSAVAVGFTVGAHSAAEADSEVAVRFAVDSALAAEPSGAASMEVFADEGGVGEDEAGAGGDGAGVGAWAGDGVGRMGIGPDTPIPIIRITRTDMGTTPGGRPTTHTMTLLMALAILPTILLPRAMIRATGRPIDRRALLPTASSPTTRTGLQRHRPTIQTLRVPRPTVPRVQPLQPSPRPRFERPRRPTQANKEQSTPRAASTNLLLRPARKC